MNVFTCIDHDTRVELGRQLWESVLSWLLLAGLATSSVTSWVISPGTLFVFNVLWWIHRRLFYKSRLQVFNLSKIIQLHTLRVYCIKLCNFRIFAYLFEILLGNKSFSHVFQQYFRNKCQSCQWQGNKEGSSQRLYI